MEDTQRHEPLPPSPPTTSEALQPRTLTLKEFLATFQFSQGSKITQEYIASYLKCLHPDLSLTSLDVDHLRTTAYRPANQIFGDKHRHRSVVADVHNGFEAALAGIQHVLNRPPQYSRATLVGILAWKILDLDLIHLDRPGGRAYETENVGHYNPYKDPWRSDLCYFGFHMNTTGIQDYDQMFADVAWYWREYANDPDPTHASGVEELNRLIGIFNQHHPDSIVTL